MLQGELSKLKRNRRMNYDHTVKESYQPRIDDEKRKQVEIRQETLVNRRLKLESEGKILISNNRLSTTIRKTCKVK